jgi:hypothetical protein
MVFSQDVPIGTWTLTTDINGNVINSKNKTTVAWQLTALSIENETNYSFTYEEYDSEGKKNAGVKEAGYYTFTPTQLILTPKASTTTYYSYIPNTIKPVSSSVKQNPLQATTYLWEYQNAKAGQKAALVIEAIHPGYREGIFNSSFAKGKQEPLASKIKRRLQSAAQ